MELLERLLKLSPFKQRASEIWQEAIKERRVFEEAFGKVSFLRLDKDVKGLKRGTILHEQGPVAGYPHINRVLHLENGIKRNMKGPFFVEEKVDGYNIRVAALGGEVLAFSRGGFVCPFSTDRVSDFIDCGRFFRDHPELVLCCEVAGPDNPYNSESPPYIEDDVRFFVFDIMEKGEKGGKGNGVLVPQEKKYGLMEEYGLPGVKVFGEFSPSEWEKVKDIMLWLDSRRYEGIVMKPAGPEGKALKYVTPYSHLNDLRLASLMVKELPPGYYTKRIIMAAFALRELGLPIEERMTELGSSLLMPLMDVQGVVAGKEEIKETFSIRMKDEKKIEGLFAHLKKSSVDVELVSKRKKDEYFHIVFTRTYRKATSFVKDCLKGSTFID